MDEINTAGSINNLSELENEFFNLPKTRGEDYFPDFLTSIFNDYLVLIEKVIGLEGDLIKDNFEKIKFFCSQIVKATEEYYSGFPVRAFKELEIGLDCVEQFIRIPPQRPGIIVNGIISLFRLRTGSNKMYSKKEMFHIPFELREKVKTQRYSIPGLPCLYLGDTIYICWEELRRPDINQIQACRFEIDINEFKLLDLSKSPANFLYLYKLLKQQSSQNWSDMFINYMVLWPLIAACSIITKNEDAIFKPEHIVPQLLLQWVSSTHKLDGIKYFSTRVNTNEKSILGTVTNYVLPVKKINKTGLCPNLIKKTKLTESISWQLLNISNPGEVSRRVVKEDIQLFGIPAIIALELINGKRLNYFETAFGKMELELFKMETKSL